jgi:hypothetical protein
MKPWELETNAMVANGKWSSPEKARTFVILRWMYLKGDLRPLADAILRNHDFDPAVLIGLAAMVFDDHTLPECLKEIAPYRLEAKRRFGKKGRPRAPETFARNFAMAEQYKALVSPGNSDKTFEAIANESGMSVSTVRHARTRYSK